MDRQFNFEECNFSVTEAAQYLRVSRSYSPIVTLEMCGGRVEVSAPLNTRVGGASEFVVIGDLIGSGRYCR
jgi:hypothetical protein